MYRVPARPIRHRIDQDAIGSGDGARLVWLLRELQVEFARIQQDFVHVVGLDRADLRAADAISQHWEQPLTMGGLASLLGLSTGAVTGTVDRLARAGFVERVPDASDRRRVHLHLTPKAEEVGMEFYAEHIAAVDRVASRFSGHARQTIESFCIALVETLAVDLDEGALQRALAEVAPPTSGPHE